MKIYRFLVLILIVLTTVFLTASCIYDTSARRILFLSDRDGGSNFYFINEDGTGLRKITNFDNIQLYANYETNPFIITASIGSLENYYDIYKMTQDGMLLRLTDNGTQNYFAVSSPDKKRIAYWFQDTGTDPEDGALWVMNSDGSNKTQVSNSYYRCDWGSWIWSPDSRYIAFSKIIKAVDSTSIFVFDDKTGRLAYGVTVPGIQWLSDAPWSPDSTRIIIESSTYDESTKDYHGVGAQVISVRGRQCQVIAGNQHRFACWINENEAAFLTNNSVLIGATDDFNMHTVLQLENTSIIKRDSWSYDNLHCVLVISDGQVGRCSGYKYDDIIKCKLMYLIFDKSGQLVSSGDIAAGCIYYGYMEWSPNSSKLAYVSYVDDNQYINTFDFISKKNKTQMVGKYEWAGSYNWSKNSTHFTFSADNYYPIGDARRQCDIFVYDTIKNIVQNVSNAPSWDCCSSFVE